MQLRSCLYHRRTGRIGGGAQFGAYGFGAPGADGKDRAAFGAGNRKDAPPRERTGVYHDAAVSCRHQVDPHEAGRKRARQHHPPDEG